MKLCRNREGYSEAWKAIVVPELSEEELALMRFLANLGSKDMGFPEGILETLARWESAGGMRPLYASFRELDRLTRIFKYLGINLLRHPDKLGPAVALRDSMYKSMKKLGKVVDCR